MNYFLARNGQQQGQYSVNDLQRMVAEGAASVTDLVWKEGMASWEPMMNVLPAPGMAATPVAVAPSPAALPFPPAAVPYGYPPPAAASSLPLPPALHWALVLLFTILTLGIFYWIWAFRQSNFVKRLDPTDSSRTLLIVALVASVVSRFGTMASYGHRPEVASLAQLVSFVTLIVAVFKMRASMVNYYNTVEPIGLRLGGGMTFFFNVLYFQHHFTRIAQWKLTGVLTPQ